MTYLNEDFLLTTKTSQRLFHEIAAKQPIMDYHCHLDPKALAANEGFSDLADLWLSADHYKWRAMRAAGEPEELITGKDADPKDKFDAWARTIPQTVRNPLHHWTHLELKRYFDCDLVLSPKTADVIWEQANAKIAETSFTTQTICEQFDIRAVGTTDDPIDSLEYHKAFNSGAQRTKMLPTFRPDKAMVTADVAAWNAWVDRLAGVAGQALDTAEDFINALKTRHDYFDTHGCRLSDHGLEACPYISCSDADAANLYSKLRDGITLKADESEQWMTYVLQQVARWNAAKGWTMQFHLGPIRNTNTRMFRQLGPDAGYDAMLDEPGVRPLAAFLDSLEQEDALPQCIFYPINPTLLYPMATLMASYQGGGVAGKMQLGSGWWHLDTLDGMRTQIEVLSSVGLLSRFVGMLTDSRSFLSFPRHEYFRRLICDIIGSEVEAGLIPEDAELLESLIRGICYENAQSYFKFPGV